MRHNMKHSNSGRSSHHARHRHRQHMQAISIESNQSPVAAHKKPHSQNGLFRHKAGVEGEGEGAARRMERHTPNQTSNDATDTVRKAKPQTCHHVTKAATLVPASATRRATDLIRSLVQKRTCTAIRELKVADVGVGSGGRGGYGKGQTNLEGTGCDV